MCTTPAPALIAKLFLSLFGKHHIPWSVDVGDVLVFIEVVLVVEAVFSILLPIHPRSIIRSRSLDYSFCGGYLSISANHCHSGEDTVTGETLERVVVYFSSIVGIDPVH